MVNDREVSSPARRPITGKEKATKPCVAQVGGNAASSVVRGAAHNLNNTTQIGTLILIKHAVIALGMCEGRHNARYSRRPA